MKVFDHLVEWDQLDLRVSGHKVQESISHLLKERKLPVSGLRLEFLGGKLFVSARIQKGLSIPLKFTVSAITVVGKTLEVRLEDFAILGILPVPRLLFRFIGKRSLPDGITLNPKTLTVTIWLERFLPGFSDLTIESIQLIPQGVAVHVGKGGADLPVGYLKEK